MEITKITFKVKLQPTHIWNTQWGPGWCGKCLLFRVGDYPCATESQLIGEVSLKKDISTLFTGQVRLVSTTKVILTNNS